MRARPETMSKHRGMATRLEEKLKRLLKPISHREEVFMSILINSPSTTPAPTTQSPFNRDETETAA
jgi:hypothetical protein